MITWKSNALFAFAAGLPISCILLFSPLNAAVNPVQNEMEADRLWMFVLLQDLFIQHGHLSSWNLGAHSDFFPDKLLAGIASVISNRAEIWLQVYAELNLARHFAIAWYFHL